MKSNGTQPRQEKSSRLTLRLVGLSVALTGVLVPGAVWLQNVRAAASCLARGGSYDAWTGHCDFILPHKRTSFVASHRVLFIAAAAALALGAVQMALGGGRPVLPFRSNRERRALLLCLSAGLVAIVLGVISLSGAQPRWMFPPWDQWGSEFWIGVLILSVDVILVLAGCRGPRKMTKSVIAVIGSFLALLAGWGLLVSCISFAVTERVIGLQFLLAFGVMAVVQWYCLRAVIGQL